MGRSTSVKAAFRQLIWLTAATAAAGFVFGNAFDYRDLAAPVLVASTVPAAAVVALRRVRPAWGPEADVPVLVALGLAMGTLLLFHRTVMGQGPWEALRTATSAAGHVWSRLGVTLPASGSPEALTAPFALTWAASTTAAELRLRAATGPAALLPATGALAVAVLLCSPQTAAGVLPACLFTVAAACDLTVRGPGTVILGSRHRSAFALLTLACVGVATAVAAGTGWLGGRLPYDFDRSAAAERTSGLDPLAQASLWASQPRRTLFRTTGDVPSGWVVARLDVYDGVRWRPSGRYLPAASLAYLSSGRPAAADVAMARVRVESLTGPYLPVPADAVSVAGLPVRASRRDGTVLVQHALTRGTAYRTGALRHPSVGVSRQAQVPDHADALPERLPGALTPWLTAATTGLPSSATPFQKASALARHLRTHYTYRPAEGGGQSLGSVQRFLTTKQGPAAAFATSFALAARELGMPCRLVVGFSSGHRLNDGSRAVGGGDVQVWAEIPSPDGSWAAFHFLPRATTGPEAGLAPPAEHSVRPTPTPTASATVQPSRSPTAQPSAPPPTATGSTRGTGTPHFPYQVFLVLPVLALLAVVWARLVAPRLRRRSARLHPTAAGRITGAWETAADRLVRHRLLGRHSPRGPDHLIAGLPVQARDVLAPQLQALGGLATQARYGDLDEEQAVLHPTWPRLADADAHRAWQLEAEIAHRCRTLARRSRADRLRRWRRAVPARETSSVPRRGSP
jgi:hypothetical protein